MPTARRVPDKVILEAPWALYPQTLSRIVDWGRSGGDPTQVLALNGEHGGPALVGQVAVVPVYGVIEHRADFWTELFGGTSVDMLRAQLRDQLADPSVRAIVLDIDSPGGSVAGITELATEIRNARGGAKPIVAVANSFAASAAYWLASQADEVVATPSAQVGSIGVYAVHQEMSRMLDEMGVTTTVVSAGPHKTEGNEFEPLTDEARADLQERVDANYQQFLSDVAAGRRTSTEQVESKYGGGRVLVANKALKVGMVDRVETLDQTIQRLGTAGGRRRAMAADETSPGLEAAASVSLGTFQVTEPVLVVTDSTTNSIIWPAEPTFSDRLAALETEASALVEHAQERARLRAKEGRPAFSTTTEKSLRTIRGAIDALLSLDDPGVGEPDEAPVEPVAAPPVDPAPVKPPEAAPIPKRFQTRDAWLRHLEALSH